jgi:signal transduction histidine kinase
MNDTDLLLRRALRFLATYSALGTQEPVAFLRGLAKTVATIPMFASGEFRMYLELVDPSAATWEIAASTDATAEIGRKYPTEVGVTGWAIRTWRTPSLIVSRGDLLPKEVALLPRFAQLASAFVWVVRRGSDPIAAVCVVSDTPDAFTPPMRETLEQLSWHLKVALGGLASLSAGRASEAADAGRPLGDDAGIDAWISDLAQKHAAKYDYAVYWRWDPQGQVLRPMWLRYPDDPTAAPGWPGPLQLGEGFAGACASSRRVVRERNVFEGRGTSTGIETPYPYIVGQIPIRSTINIPVTDADRVYGVISALSDSPSQFDHDEAPLQRLATMLAEALRRLDDRRLDLVERDVAEALLGSLNGPDPPGTFWPRVSAILRDLERRGLFRAAALYVGKRQEPDVFSCKSVSPNADPQRGIRIDSRLNETFRHLLSAAAGIQPLAAQLHPPAMWTHTEAADPGLRFWLKHYPAGASDAGLPTLLAVAALNPASHWAGPFGKRDLSPSLSQVFLFFFAVARAILTAADLARLDKTRLTVMSAATHDLRAPIASIRTDADGMTGLAGKNAELRRHIIGRTDAALLSIENLLYEWTHDEDLRNGREHGKARASELMSLRDVLAVASSLCREAEQNHPDHRFHLELPVEAPGKWYIPATAHLFRLALRNVLDNAVKFGRHTPVIMRLDTSDASEREGGHRTLRIEIRDHGMGVPAENLRTIFESGRSHAYSRKEVTVGAHIGLSITKAIIEGFHGKIWAQSERNRGTVMQMTLPLLERDR